MKSTIKFSNFGKLIFSVAIIFFSLNGFSQAFKEGKLKSLIKSNGYKGIVLGADISDVMMHYRLSYLDDNTGIDADSCITYACNDSTLLAMPGKLSLNIVGIRTYKNKIINIYLFFDMNDSYKILGDFLKQYGQFNSLPYEYTNIYDWKTPKVDLSLKYTPGTELGIAVFTCNPLAAEVENNHKIQQQMFMQTSETYLASRGVYANGNQE
jgi:hypothetical protein